MRTLTLTNSNIAVDRSPDGYQMHWELWLQLGIVFKKMTGLNLTPSVSAKQAHALANELDCLASKEGWQIHMHQWGDHDGHLLDEFRNFLRGGAFTVQDHSKHA